MKAILYEEFNHPPKMTSLPDPTPENHGVVIKVEATGLCRSDWHGWKGHDPDITLPHVPGHELAGTVQAVGKNVSKWSVGDRVTVPFVGGCGTCGQCISGHQHICDFQFQPGFTHWGSFAEYVSIHYADGNLVELPETIDFSAAASLGCRFATSWRAIIDQGRLKAGEWVGVHGCGGVGLSAIMIARAFGAQVIAVDINDNALDGAQKIGADACINSTRVTDVGEAVKEVSNGGVHLSIDAIGHPDVCYQSVCSLRKQGRHVQVGLIMEKQSGPLVPIARVIADELEILGSHGMQAWRYPEMMSMIAKDHLRPQELINRKISLEQSINALVSMDKTNDQGITIIDQF